MNREIKFRAWDKQRNEMFYPSQLVPLSYKRNVSMEMSCQRYTGDDPSELMQYTGLKDINSVEIYEGDIVKIIDLTSRKKPFIAEVYYCLNTASFSGKVKGYPIELFLHNPINRNNYIKEMQPFITERTIEVIGNIYEHPHLLK